MKLCVQGTVNLAPTEFWKRFVESLPPEERRVGKVDMGAKTTPDSPYFPFDMEITHWEEEHAIAARMNGPWYMRQIDFRLHIEPVDTERSRVWGSVRFRSPLNLLLRLAYRLFRHRANHLIIQDLADMRHELETGQKVSDDNRATVRLDDIQIVRCNAKTVL